MKPADPLLRNLAEILDDPSRHGDLFNAFPSVVWCADGHGHCSFVNQAWEDYTGRRLENEVGARWLESVHPEDRGAVERAWQEAHGLRRSFECDYRLRRADGEYGWIHHTAVPVNDETGRLAGYIGNCHDITDRRAAELAARSREQEARESEERLRKFAEATNEGIVFQENGRISDCNDAIVRLSGYTYDELVGSELIQYVAPDCRETVIANVRGGLERPYETAVVHKDGTRIPVEVEGREVRYSGRVYRMSVVRDIRDRKAAEERIQFLAHHDILTGLPNRASMLDRLEFVLASARRHASHVGMLFIDLDNFKTVNDSLGHAAGDELLKIVARRIQQSLRSVDVVSRLGGDEFLVILPDLESEQGAVPVAEKLLAAVTAPVALESHSVAVSPSIGISIYPRDGTSADVLIRNADAAMYLAKERGRCNYQFFNQALAEAAYRSLAMENRLRAAIAGGAFELHYQPQVRVTDGSLTGIEALIRWPQADGTWVEPNHFIPLAETRGLIMPIGEWVLHEACRQNREWQSQGLPQLTVAVNLSTIQFRQKNLVADVERVLRDTGLEARFLAFELTESMLMEDTSDMLRTLEGLRGLGVKIAIDDFGTGHSSLAHLKRFPIDKLKIDRTFVRDTPADAEDVAIVSAIIDLARNLGITSIAEGVDRVEQLEFLRSRGCEEMQGFLMSRALPADKFTTWLARPHSGTITAAHTA